MVARDLADDLLARAARLRAPSGPTVRPDVLAGCFPEQLSFIRDPSPLKFALCTRRAAKSYSFGLECIDDSFDHPRADYVFIGLTRESARKVFWQKVLKDIDQKYDLRIDFNESRLAATMPNGATIYVLGADSNEKEKRKLLGGKNRKVCIDEGQAWNTDLRDLVMSVIKPSLVDERGSLSLLGTPGNLTRGFFADVTRGCTASTLGPASLREPGWSGHCWTTFENPYVVEEWKAEIDELIANNPRIEETPSFQQNYRGRWVVDLDALVYHYQPNVNSWDGILPRFTDPRGSWHHVLGIDLGYSPDPSAFVLMCYHDFQPSLFVIESWKEWKMDITNIAQKVKQFQARFEIDTLVIDGSARQAVEEMRRRHNLNLTAADKQEKSHFQGLLNDDLVQGRILIDVEACAGGLQNREVKGRGVVKESLALVDELTALIWDPRKLSANKRVEHPACANHLCDALLYGWRACYPYLARTPDVAPVPGSPEAFEAEVQRMWDAELAEVDANRPPPRGWDDDGDLDPFLH